MEDRKKGFFLLKVTNFSKNRGDNYFKIILVSF